MAFVGIVLTASADQTNNSSSTIRQVTVRPVSPVDYFRELLTMSPAQRERALAEKPAKQKADLLAKIKEYEAMSPEERELRLRMTTLRWHLVPLLKMTPIERMKSLAAIAPEDRELVERRLKLWDEIPIQLQKQFLKNEKIIGDLLRLEASTPDQREAFLKTFPPERRQELENGMAQWQAVAANERHALCERFEHFFDLTKDEKEKALNVLSPIERDQMEKTIASFEKLPPTQRKHCINSFQKFVGMSVDERSQFLKNAERWQTMTPSEREAWREVVQKSRPPLPPPPPPFPPSPVPTRYLVATNAP